MLGLLNTGDEIHEINGESIKGLEPDRIVEILVSNLHSLCFFP